MYLTADLYIYQTWDILRVEERRILEQLAKCLLFHLLGGPDCAREREEAAYIVASHLDTSIKTWHSFIRESVYVFQVGQLIEHRGWVMTAHKLPFDVPVVHAFCGKHDELCKHMKSTFIDKNTHYVPK